MDQQTSGMETGIDQARAEYVGRWNRLVSKTNWEKGQIICQWREQLEQDGLPASAYTDEAWSLAVGNVSPQHVGRLRRVYQRFAQVADTYPKLFWSHFQAAIDWDDAEMWLEGAVQSGWSVAEMRAQRWQARGGAGGAEPLGEELPPSEFDEDSDPPAENRSAAVSEVYAPAPIEPSEAGDGVSSEPWTSGEPEEAIDNEPAEATSAPVRPFENLPRLPKDLAEAFEQFKLALLKHKVAGWQEVPCGHVLAAIEALKQLVTAP